MIRPESSEFSAIIENYAQSHRAYRAFRDHVTSSLSRLEEEEPLQFSERVTPFVSALSREEREEVSAALTSLEEALEALGREPGSEGDASRIVLEISGEAGRAFAEMVKIFARHVPPSTHRALLYRSIIIGVVTQFEVLIADIAHQFYLRAPGAVATDDKVLSVNELREFDTLEDAVAFVVERRIDDLLRGSSEDWREFLKSRLNIDLGDIAPDWERVKEHIQRRHLLVHTAGRVSRRYLASISSAVLKELFDEVKVGDRIELTEHYVEECLTNFTVTGMHLAFRCWLKLAPGEADAAERMLSDFVYEQLVGRRFRVAEQLASFGAGETAFSASTRNVSLINTWLAQKRLGRWDEVRQEVAEFDTSALHPRFAAAHAGLLNDVDRFCSVVDSNEGAGLDHQAWEEWPVFEDIRDDPRFVECAERHLVSAEPPAQEADEEDETEEEAPEGQNLLPNGSAGGSEL